jgi:signal transduction histidine kinase
MFENAQLEAWLGTALNELRASRARLLEATDHERQRLERDLHDGVQQQLVALSIKVTLAHDLAEGNPQLARRLRQLQVEIDGALDGLRDLTEHLAPPLLDAEGLVPALRAAATRSPLRVRVEAALERRYAPGVEAAVYHSCLEALENAAEHGGPGVRVGIEVAAVDGELRFVIHDDGRGFDPSTTVEGHGFANMRDRLGAVGGAFTVDSAEGRGTLVSGTVPL